METKLNKMKWLQEQGFEPDYIFYSEGWCKDGVADLRKVSDLEGFTKGVNCWFGGNKYAWFTESKLWSLLPEIIILDEAVFFRKLNNYIMYEPTYFDIDEKEGKPPMACLYIKEVKDLHDALLDIVIWCVENEHLKAEQ